MPFLGGQLEESAWVWPKSTRAGTHPHLGVPGARCHTTAHPRTAARYLGAVAISHLFMACRGASHGCCGGPSPSFGLGGVARHQVRAAFCVSFTTVFSRRGKRRGRGGVAPQERGTRSNKLCANNVKGAFCIYKYRQSGSPPARVRHSKRIIYYSGRSNTPSTAMLLPSYKTPTWRSCASSRQRGMRASHANKHKCVIP